MKRDDKHASSSGDLKRSSGAGIWLTLADTTWRVAVPTVLLSGLGMLADTKWHAVPLWTLVGLVLGLASAGALVWRQLKIVEKSGDSK